jgi:hypothetical protein
MGEVLQMSVCHHGRSEGRGDLSFRQNAGIYAMCDPKEAHNREWNTLWTTRDNFEQASFPYVVQRSIIDREFS